MGSELYPDLASLRTAFAPFSQQKVRKEVKPVKKLEASLGYYSVSSPWPFYPAARHYVRSSGRSGKKSVEGKDKGGEAHGRTRCPHTTRFHLPTRCVRIHPVVRGNSMDAGAGRGLIYFSPPDCIFFSPLFPPSSSFSPLSPPPLVEMQGQRPAPQVQDARERLRFCVTLPGMARTQHFMCSHLLPVPIGRAPAAAAAPCHAGSALRRFQL